MKRVQQLFPSYDAYYKTTWFCVKRELDEKSTATLCCVCCHIQAISGVKRELDEKSTATLRLFASASAITLGVKRELDEKSTATFLQSKPSHTPDNLGVKRELDEKSTATFHFTF